MVELACTTWHISPVFRFPCVPSSQLLGIRLCVVLNVMYLLVPDLYLCGISAVRIVSNCVFGLRVVLPATTRAGTVVVCNVYTKFSTFSRESIPPTAVSPLSHRQLCLLFAPGSDASPILWK